MTDRYPTCEHRRFGIVTSGSSKGAHAATNVCARTECIEDAMQWAEDITGLPAEFIPDSERER